MKKIIILMAFMLVAFTQADAQVWTLNGSHATTDTVTDAGTTYLTSGSLVANKSGKYSVALLTANISGTSTFKAILQGSVDGTNWSNYFGTVGTNGIGCDTLQVTSAAPAYFVWNSGLPSSAAIAGRRLYIRIACVGTGTQSTRVSAKLITQD
jgi:hypothetical protein